MRFPHIETTHLKYTFEIGLLIVTIVIFKGSPRGCTGINSPDREVRNQAKFVSRKHRVFDKSSGKIKITSDKEIKKQIEANHKQMSSAGNHSVHGGLTADSDIRDYQEHITLFDGYRTGQLYKV